MPDRLDGRTCPDSTGGVHSWPYTAGSWGNARYIDDWVYAQAVLQNGNQIVYPDVDQAAAIAGQKNMLPLVLAVVGVVVVLTGGAVSLVMWRKKRQQQPLSPQQTTLADTTSQPDNHYDGTPPVL